MSERTLSRFFLLSHDLTGYAVCVNAIVVVPQLHHIGHDASAGWHIVLARCRLSEWLCHYGLYIHCLYMVVVVKHANKLSLRSRDEVELSEKW